MTETPKFETREDGPIILKHARRMQAPDGEDIEVKEVMALCRCGKSGNKPFCDGSHSAAGFTSKNEHEAAGPDREFTYSGDPTSIVYNPRLCSHAAECVRLSKAAFDPSRKPWCKPEEADASILEDIVKACPSGALRSQRSGETRHILADRPTVLVQKNGPYWVSDAEIDGDLPGVGGTKKKYVLCRCGLSGNKPYCDGTHHDQKWSDAE